MYPVSSDTVPSRSRKIALCTLKHLACGSADRIGCDSSHAAMIDRAFAQHAWAAIDRFADHARARAPRTGDGVIGGAEYGYGWSSQGCGDMHRSGIVRDHQFGLLDHA